MRKPKRQNLPAADDKLFEQFQPFKRTVTRRAPHMTNRQWAVAPGPACATSRVPCHRAQRRLESQPTGVCDRTGRYQQRRHLKTAAGNTEPFRKKKHPFQPDVRGRRKTAVEFGGCCLLNLLPPVCTAIFCWLVSQIQSIENDREKKAS